MSKNKKKNKKEIGKKIIAWTFLIAMIASLFTTAIVVLAS